MKKLNFIYKVHYSFSTPVTDHCYALRILPGTNEEQGIYASEYSISGGNSIVGEELRSAGAVSIDGFGNRLITGRIEALHDSFEILVTGTAFTDRGRPKKRALYEPVYRYPTDLTRPGEKLRELYLRNCEVISANAAAAAGGGASELQRALQWMNLLYRSFVYEPGVTGIRTTAEEALSGGRGVCQDYAHILISLLRMDGIPARYIAGMLLGEGASHAWVEAQCDGYWIGLDPTHNCCLTDDYVEVAAGRDYRDCIMDRGIFRGYALQEQQVYVQVSEQKGTSVGRLNIL